MFTSLIYSLCCNCALHLNWSTIGNTPNVYDSVPQQNNEDNLGKETFSMPALDNTALYSMRENEEVQKSQK